jgi:hypothetical protein
MNENNRPHLENTAYGAAAGSALPTAALVDYEARVNPSYKRKIDRLLARAESENKLFARVSGGRDLQKNMRLGDLVLQSYTGEDLLAGLKRKDPSFVTMSLGGSGSPFAHSAVALGNGNVIDPGKTGLETPGTHLIKKFRQWRKHDVPKGEDWRTVRDNLRNIMIKGESNSEFLNRIGRDFMSSYDHNVNVVLRPQNVANIPREALEDVISKQVQLPYGKERATSSGLRRIFSPFADLVGRGSNQVRKSTCFGTYCSDGTAQVTRALGLRPGRKGNVLPPDFLDMLSRKEADLVGLHVSDPTLRRYATAGGELGPAQIKGAARAHMREVLRNAAKTRRMFSGAAIGSTAAVGGLSGLLYSVLTNRKNSHTDRIPMDLKAPTTPVTNNIPA